MYKQHKHCYKNWVPMATHYFPVSQIWFHYFWWFYVQQTYNIFICLLHLADEGPLANIKIQRQRRPGKLLLLRRSGTQYAAMGTRLLLWSSRSRNSLQRIRHFWYKLADIYIFFIIADQDSVEFVTLSLG